MKVRSADDSNPMPPQIYGDFLWVYQERQRRINGRELNYPIQCSDDGRQDQAGQLQAPSRPQPNHPTGENYGHQVQQHDGTEARNEQLWSQFQASQIRRGTYEQTVHINPQPDHQQAHQSQNVAGNYETGGDVVHSFTVSNDPSANSNSLSVLQPNQIPDKHDKPQNALKRIRKFLNRFKTSSQSRTENNNTEFDPYDLPNNFPQLEVNTAAPQLPQGYQHIITSPMMEHYYMNMPQSNEVLPLDEQRQQVGQIL